MNRKKMNVTRRQFLGGAAGAAGVLILPRVCAGRSALDDHPEQPGEHGPDRRGDARQTADRLDDEDLLLRR